MTNSKKVGGNRKRHIIQWSILSVMLLTVAFGWRYPILGFSVPLVMLTGIVGSMFNGRFVCGNLCPRGGFFDRIMSRLSPRRGIPAGFRNPYWRWFLFVLLMGLMLYRLMRNPADWSHWGSVFWMMCLITTGIGIVLAFFLHPRAWCSFCPIGTVQSAIGGGKNQLRIDADSCVECGVCEKRCPFDLTIFSYKNQGLLPDPDCLKCSECVVACPKAALQWPVRDKSASDA